MVQEPDALEVVPGLADAGSVALLNAYLQCRAEEWQIGEAPAFALHLDVLQRAFADLLAAQSVEESAAEDADLTAPGDTDPAAAERPNGEDPTSNG